MSMTTDPGHTEHDTRMLLELASRNVRDIEREWKVEREKMRRHAVSLIIDHGESIHKVSEITGNHRKTITLWVQIERAEMRGRGSGSTTATANKGS